MKWCSSSSHPISECEYLLNISGSEGSFSRAKISFRNKLDATISAAFYALMMLLWGCNTSDNKTLPGRLPFQ